MKKFIVNYAKNEKGNVTASFKVETSMEFGPVKNPEG